MPPGIALQRFKKKDPLGACSQDNRDIEIADGEKEKEGAPSRLPPKGVCEALRYASPEPGMDVSGALPAAGARRSFMRQGRG